MIEKYKRGGVNDLIIKMDEVYKTGSGVLGLDGKEIVLGDADYNREKNAKTVGTVILTPVSLSKKPLYGLPDGVPGYGPLRLPDADVSPHSAIYATPKNQYKFINDIIPEVQIGDKVYVAWTAIFDRRNMIAQAPDKKSFIFRVPYEQVYCCVRDGKVIPIGAHVLIDPIFETWESILKPVYYDFKDALGQPVPKPKDQWIQVRTAPKHVEREGVIKHIGTLLKGDTCLLKPGMKVLYKPKLQNLLEIEGQKYFIVRQNQILLFKHS